MKRELLPVASADTCPVCDADHDQLGDQIACARLDPRTGLRHGHRLIFVTASPDRAIYACPAHRCQTVIAAPKPRKEPPVTSLQPATTPAPSTELAIRDDQPFWEKKQLAALRQLGIHDAPNADLAVFFHYCKAHRLDPFSRQATMIRYGDKWTIQTEIDGYRLIAARAAKRDGRVLSYRPTLYYSKDGEESTVWLSDGPPAAVIVTIQVDGAPFPGIARYESFVPRHPKTGKPMGLWEKMPDHQLAKCAEAQALRRAFPTDLEGTHIPEETPPPPQPAPWHEAATAPPRKSDAENARRFLIAQIGRKWDTLGADEDERLNLTAMLIGTGTVLDGLSDLTTDQLSNVLDRLVSCDEIGQVHALIDRGDRPPQDDDPAYD